MPALANPKKELLAHALPKYNFNKTKAVHAVYKCSYESAHTNCHLRADKGVEKRALEIAQQDKQLTPEAVLLGFKEDLSSTKALPFEPVAYVPDNSTRLEARKTLMKAYGLLEPEVNREKIHNSIHTDNLTINQFKEAIQKLDSISAIKDTQTGEIAEELED